MKKGCLILGKITKLITVNVKTKKKEQIKTEIQKLLHLQNVFFLLIRQFQKIFLNIILIISIVNIVAPQCLL